MLLKSFNHSQARKCVGPNTKLFKLTYEDHSLSFLNLCGSKSLKIRTLQKFCFNVGFSGYCPQCPSSMATNRQELQIEFVVGSYRTNVNRR